MATLHVVVYSSNAATRQQVIDIVGRCPHAGWEPLEFHEIATSASLFDRLADKPCDLVVLDGEAAPAGGLGIARQLGDELAACPPLLVLLARPADTWLAKWSGADSVVGWQSDPIGFSALVVRILLNQRVSPAG